MLTTNFCAGPESLLLASYRLPKTKKVESSEFGEKKAKKKMGEKAAVLKKVSDPFNSPAEGG